MEIDDELESVNRDILNVQKAKEIVWRLWCEAFPQFRDTWQIEMLGETIVCVTPKRWKLRLGGFLDPGLSAIRVELWGARLAYLEAIHIYNPRFKELGVKIAKELNINTIRIRDTHWVRELDEYFR